LRIIISGHKGFIGEHMVRNLKLFYPKKDLIFLKKKDFDNPTKLTSKIKKNDFIFHLAGVNIASEGEDLFDSNYKINYSLFLALKKVKFSGVMFFSSSLKEKTNSIYGKAKKEGRKMFEKLSSELNFKFNCLQIPNVYGPFCKPNYNSFIATFSYNLINKIPVKIIEDNNINLIYVDDLIDILLKSIEDPNAKIDIKQNLNLIKVSKVLEKLNYFFETYICDNEFPKLDNDFDIKLFNSFRSYINLKKHYPVSNKIHHDERGLFSELSRSHSKGQSSISFTKPGYTRGNHFHKRKIERFTVLKGEAEIQIRKFMTNEIISYKLSGERTSFIDIPIWYIHNIKNIGKEMLITHFWINEHFQNKDNDTFPEKI